MLLRLLNVRIIEHIDRNSARGNHWQIIKTNWGLLLGMIGKMENLLQRFCAHITLAKVICLVLLFSPLWGWWWFHIDHEVNWVLPLMIGYPSISFRAGVVYISICLLAFLGFVIVAFIRSSVVRVPLMFIMLIGNHHGRTEDVWLIGLGTGIVILLLLDLRKQRTSWRR